MARTAASGEVCPLASSTARSRVPRVIQQDGDDSSNVGAGNRSRRHRRRCEPDLARRGSSARPPGRTILQSTSQGPQVIPGSRPGRDARRLHRIAAGLRPPPAPIEGTCTNLRTPGLPGRAGHQHRGRLATCGSTTQGVRFWVGLDGYSDPTMEGTGVTGVCYDRATAYLTWYEMSPLTYGLAYNPQPGDHISASVTYKGSNTFSLNMADTTQGWSHTVTATVAGASRSSAEVIAEDPVASSGSNLPMTDFGTVNFTGATVNGSALGNVGTLTAMNLIDSEGQSLDTISALSGGENFSATWRRSS